MSKTEVIRCLKRYVAREVSSALQALNPYSPHHSLDFYKSIGLSLVFYPRTGMN